MSVCTKRYLSLALCLFLLCLMNLLTLQASVHCRASDYEVKIEAAELMDRCMARIRDHKALRGIPMSPEDLLNTGLIGEEFNGLTTTLGPVEGKRTAADPNMAAMAVQLLREAGVTPGDRVGAVLSGSFPGLDLAVLCACAALEVDLDYMTSAGSSTFGANWPLLTFPEIACLLAEDGLLPAPPMAWSLGGHRDCGLDMDPRLTDQVRDRMDKLGIPFLYEEDFSANLARRMELLQQDGPLRCFVGVGGNLTVSGNADRELGCGLLSGLQPLHIDEHSGLLEIYSSMGLPVIYLLNIKNLAAEYGLPYDPPSHTAPGSGPLYEEIRYPIWPCILGTAASLALLWYTGRHSAAHKKECCNFECGRNHSDH